MEGKVKLVKCGKKTVSNIKVDEMTKGSKKDLPKEEAPLWVQKVITKASGSETHSGSF